MFSKGIYWEYWAMGPCHKSPNAKVSIRVLTTSFPRHVEGDDRELYIYIYVYQKSVNYCVYSVINRARLAGERSVPARGQRTDSQVSVGPRDTPA